MATANDSSRPAAGAPPTVVSPSSNEKSPASNGNVPPNPTNEKPASTTPSPLPESTQTVKARLQLTIDNATRVAKVQNLWEKFHSSGINITIILQILISATITVLSALRGDYSIVTAVLGAVATVLGGLLARWRGTNQPERAQAHATAMSEFLDECKDFVTDYGTMVGEAFDAKINELRTKYGTIEENADKAERGQMPTLAASTPAPAKSTSAASLLGSN